MRMASAWPRWLEPALRGLLLGTILTYAAPAVLPAQLLETETARLPPAGGLQLDNTFEVQNSSDGTELALPQSLQVGLTGRVEFMVEPVLYTAIRPKVGRRATGLGDLEVTMTYLVRRESSGAPALAAAAEIKLPTARDSLIGTRATDYTGYLIASKLLGHVDTHINLAYAVIGRPAGAAAVRNTFNFAGAAELRLDPHWEVAGEILGNTSASTGGGEGGGSEGEGAGNPEIAGGEVVGLLGFRYHVTQACALALGVTYDNNNAVLVRSVFSLRLR